MSIELLKSRVREIGRQYRNREQRSKRLFVEERAASMASEREREFSIKSEVSSFFNISYSAVCFCGSGQIGFSITKDKLFEPGVSDLDVACIDVNLFQIAWSDVIETTRAFSDQTPFGSRDQQDIDRLKDQILRRGMIRVGAMPQSKLSKEWSGFEGRIGRNHTEVFKRITFAIYMNEYAFCWKQDSALSSLMSVA